MTDDKYKGHTPGPWLCDRVDEPSGLIGWWVYTPGQHIANLRENLDTPGGMNAATARLIADAPTLLAQRDEAVRVMRQMLDVLVRADKWHTELDRHRKHDEWVDGLDDRGEQAVNDTAWAIDKSRAFLATLEDDNDDR